jgi:hypothetical protein
MGTMQWVKEKEKIEITPFSCLSNMFYGAEELACMHGQRDGYLRPHSRFSRPKPLLLPSSSSVVLTRLTHTLTLVNKCNISKLVLAVTPNSAD